MNKDSKQIFISMMKFQIKTIVASNKKQIGWYKKEFLTQPDKRFGGGVGKVQLLNHYKVVLPEEDGFFEEDPLNCLIYQQRWEEFLSDCVAMACLHEFLTHERMDIIDKQVIHKGMKAIPVSDDELKRWQRSGGSSSMPH